MNNFVYYENYNAGFFFFSLVILIIAIVVLALCYLISINNSYYEKLSGYECGFDPFSDAREPFHVKFYLISILFIIFDVETLFLLPWFLSLTQLSLVSMLVFIVFFLLLCIGFYYEWQKNCLDWD